MPDWHQCEEYEMGLRSLHRFACTLMAVATSGAALAQDASGDAPVMETIPVAPETPAPSAPPPAHREGPVGMGEIVVTAQRREENISDIPLAITAYSGEDLQTLGVTDTRDLGKVVPGFVASDSGYSVPVYTLRGIGFNDISYSSTGTVGVYADEVSMPYAIMTRGANLDLKRVEVLKGPQGTLYGRNSTGGTVNYIANQPTNALESGFSLTAGRFETAEGEGFISGPLTETLRGRVAAHVTKSWQGWQESQTREGDHLGKLDSQSARAILDWQPDDDLKLALTLSGWNDEREPQAPWAVAFFAQNPFTGFALADPQVESYPYKPDNDDPQNADWDPGKKWQLHDHFWSPAARADWHLADDLDFTGLLSYGRFNSDKSLLPQSGLAVLQSEQEITAQIETVSSEARLAGKLGENVHWLAGVSAAFDKTDEFHKVFIEHNTFNFPPPIVGNPTGIPFSDDKVGQTGKTKAHSYGVFGNVEWQFTDTLKFTQGIRYTTEQRTYEGCTFITEDSVGLIGLSNVFSAVSLATGTGAAVFDILQSILAGDTTPLIQKGECFTLDENSQPGLFKGKLKEHNVATRSVLDWSPRDGLMFYGSYTRGYKSGGFPVILAARQANFTPVTQEKLIAYELGAKTTLFDGMARLDGALFYYDYRDKQLLTFTLDPFFGALPLIRNAPTSNVYGAEISLSVTPVDGLYLALVASGIKTEIEEFVSTTAEGDQFDFSGQPFNFSPEFSATFIAAYGVPVGRFVLTPGADVTHASSTNGTLEENPNYDIPSYTMIGARLKLEPEGGNWSVTAFGRNLTNEIQRIGVFRTGDSVAATAAFPRTYGLMLEMRWD